MGSLQVQNKTFPTIVNSKKYNLLSISSDITNSCLKGTSQKAPE